MAWEPPHLNKWGYYGYNCKMRPQGHGTTHATRKAHRAHKQWGYLEEVEELKQKKEAEEEASHSYSSSSSASSSSRSSSKSSKKKRKSAATLEKVAEEPAAEAPLEKDAKEAIVAEGGATLEKVVVRRTRRAKNGVAEQLTEANASQSQPSEPTKPETVLGFTPPLEKGEAAVKKEGPSLEKELASCAASGSKDAQLLEKSSDAQLLEKSSDAQLLEKSSAADEPKKVVLKARRHRPTVVVDWHNTLEKVNRVAIQPHQSLGKATECSSGMDPELCEQPEQAKSCPA